MPILIIGIYLLLTLVVIPRIINIFSSDTKAKFAASFYCLAPSVLVSAILNLKSYYFLLGCFISVIIIWNVLYRIMLAFKYEHGIPFAFYFMLMGISSLIILDDAPSCLIYLIFMISTKIVLSVLGKEDRITNHNKTFFTFWRRVIASLMEALIWFIYAGCVSKHDLPLIKVLIGYNRNKPYSIFNFFILFVISYICYTLLSLIEPAKKYIRQKKEQPRRRSWYESLVEGKDFTKNQKIEIAEGIIKLKYYQIENYARKEFNYLQMREIRLGYENNLSDTAVDIYVNPKLSSDRMCSLRQDLEFGLLYSHVKAYANPYLSEDAICELRQQAITKYIRAKDLGHIQ